MDALLQLVTKKYDKHKLTVIVFFWMAILGITFQTGIASGNENHKIVTLNNNSPELSLRGIEFTSGNLWDVSEPDLYGYQWDNSVTYNWKDPTGATVVTLSQPDYGFAGPINLGFSFPFYENTYSQVFIGANGFLSFPNLKGTTGFDANQSIPTDIAPNDIIAPFWSDLALGSGTVSIMTGSEGDNQYFVVNYLGVSKRLSPSDLLTFQVILYENGDIWFQYNTLAGDLSATVGIEDGDGLDGSTYSLTLQNSFAIRFQRPPDEARVKVLPLFQSGLTEFGVQNFFLDVRNTGELGTDTYNLTTLDEGSGNPGWLITLWQEDGSQGLTDTNGDSIVDTGAIPQGQTKRILVKLQAPSVGDVGDHASFVVTATSLLDSEEFSASRFQVANPAGHFIAFGNSAGLDLGRITSTGQTLFDNISPSSGSNPALLLVREHYFYAWEHANADATDIEYAVVGYGGHFIEPSTKLTDNAEATFPTSDISPALAVSRDNRVGVVWVRRMIDNQGPEFWGENYNVYFAILDLYGNILVEPINITNNGPCDDNPQICWANGINEDVPVYSSPVIMATSDNRFVISWIDSRILSLQDVTDIGYVAYDTDGNPLMLTSDDLKNGNTGGDLYSDPRLMELPNNRMLFTYTVFDPNTQAYTPAFEVHEIVSDPNTIGVGIQEDVLLTGVHGRNPDSILLGNSHVLIAWTNTDTNQIEGGVLSDDGTTVTFNNQIIQLPSPDGRKSNFVSVTATPDGIGILTWIDIEGGNRVYYALIASNGQVITPPMIAWMDNQAISVSRTGQGIAPIPDWSVYMPIIYR